MLHLHPATGEQSSLSAEKMRKSTTLKICLFITFCFFRPLALAEGSPSDVVSRFCQLDFEGNRLSSEKYKEIEKIVGYPSEPGWDTVVGVSSFKISKEKIKGDSAEVRVFYEVNQTWPAAQTEETEKFKEETFVLEKDNGHWVILKPIRYPRVSSIILCEQYNYCNENR